MVDHDRVQPLVAITFDEAAMCSNMHFDHTNVFHPEIPARVKSAIDHLRAVEFNGPESSHIKLWEYLEKIPCNLAETDMIRLVHSDKLVTTVSYWTKILKKINEARRKYTQSSDSKDFFGTVVYPFCQDTFLTEHTEQVARLALGGILVLCDVLYKNSKLTSLQVNKAFALIRPPGHHASVHDPYGYCIYNNVAIAAKYIMKNYGIKKVGIVDWDVHHGNGTQDIYYSDPSVLFFSMHRYGDGMDSFYPYTGNIKEIGEDDGLGYNYNFGLEVGYGDYDIMHVFENVIVPALDAFEPEVILVSAGFDSATNDILGGCCINPSGYIYMTWRLCELARKHCSGKLLVALEGGYETTVTKTCIAAVLQTMISFELGIDVKLLEPDDEKVKESTKIITDTLGKIFKKHLLLEKDEAEGKKAFDLADELQALQLNAINWINYVSLVPKTCFIIAAGHTQRWIVPTQEEVKYVAKMCSENEALFYEWMYKINSVDVHIHTQPSEPYYLPIEGKSVPVHFSGVRISKNPNKQPVVPYKNFFAQTRDANDIPCNDVAKRILQHVIECSAIYKTSVFDKWELSDIPEKTSVLVKNALYGLKVPCVMDLKMGTKLYGEDLVDEAAIKFKEAKAASRACDTHGFHISGIFKWDIESGVAFYLDADLVHSAKTDERMVEIFDFYLQQVKESDSLKNHFISELNAIRSIFMDQSFLAFYGTSLLLVYDAALQGEDLISSAKVYMIDFSHVSYNTNKLDEGYLLGLDSLLRLFASTMEG